MTKNSKNVGNPINVQPRIQALDTSQLSAQGEENFMKLHSIMLQRGKPLCKNLHFVAFTHTYINEYICMYMK